MTGKCETSTSSKDVKSDVLLVRTCGKRYEYRHSANDRMDVCFSYTFLVFFGHEKK
jgi:hypothetical protein